MPRIRRAYTPEFKAEAVKFVTEQGYSVAEAARSLGINPNRSATGSESSKPRANTPSPVAASEHYQLLLARHGITCSMSRKADC
jgi:transposase